MNRTSRTQDWRIIAIAGILCFHAGIQSAVALPEEPSIRRSVVERYQLSDNSDRVVFENARFPSFHTSADGRVALDIKDHGAKVYWYLFVPEKLTQPFANIQVANSEASVANNAFIVIADGTGQPTAGDDTTSNDDRYTTDVSRYHVGGDVRHVTIIDTTREFINGLGQNNPQNVNGDDVYKLVVHSTAEFVSFDPPGGQPVADYIKHFFTKVTVTVRNPKMSNAYIYSITHEATQDASAYIPVDGLLETRFTNDGKLLVGRIGTNPNGKTDRVRFHAPDGDPSFGGGTSLSNTQYADVVYAYLKSGILDANGNLLDPDGDPADPADGFDNLIPISYAPYDPRINGTRNGTGDTFMPFAAFPFRDGSGNLIPKGYDLQVSYPWIDSDGRTLVFTALKQHLTVPDPDSYPNSALPGYAGGDIQEETNHFMGQSMIGLWTQGKMITLDNRLNNTDFPLSDLNVDQRMVTLYEDREIDPAIQNGAIRVGSGRFNGNGDPFADVGNSAFFDSIENKLNAVMHAQPSMPRDVVWWVTNGRATDQFAFDDYLNKDGFILSKMNAALEFNPSVSLTTNRPDLLHHNGWNGSAFLNPVRVANDATAVGQDVVNARPGLNSSLVRWEIPENGLMTGPGVRIEPIAHGGIEGKGAWLDAGNGIAYAIPTQPRSVSATPWYVGVFVDSRDDSGSTAERRLLTFPDGSSIRTVGRSSIRYYNASAQLAQITLPVLWSRNQWTHFGFQIYPGGNTVDFYQNGFLVASTSDLGAIFQLTPGTLTVGHANGANGHRGWYDDFVVFAQFLNPEVAANHARGTLVKFNEGNPNTATLEARADLYAAMGSEAEADIFDALYHTGQIDPSAATSTRFSVHYDYSNEYGAHLNNFPTGATSIRKELLFPESPVFKEVHRPSSLGNAFCFTCHDNANPWAGMKVDALLLNSSITAPNDHRRQPIDALRRVFGNIPANWLGSGNIASVANPTTGNLVDLYTLVSENPSSRKVTTFSLVNPATGMEINPLENDSIVDSSVNYTVRANLDAGQGSVVFQVFNAGTTADPVYTNTVNEAPYALFGSSVLNQQIVLNAQGTNLPNGTYNIKATPFRDSNGAGVQGIAKTITGVSIVSGGGGGGTPSFVAAGAIAAGAGTIQPGLPSGVSSGDILLLFIETANQTLSISNANGGTWAQVPGSYQGTGATAGVATALTVFWSRYNGTQGAPTVSDSGNHQIARMIAVRGAVATGTPWDVMAGGVEATSDTSASITGATTTVDNTLVVLAIAGADPDANGTSNFSGWANPDLTAVTERTDDTATANNGGALGIATGVKTSAGTYGITSATLAVATRKAVFTIAIKR